MIGYLTLLILLISTYLFTLLSRPKGVTDFLITYFILVVAQLICSANLLSYFDRLNSVHSWFLTGFIFILISFLILFYRGESSYRPDFWSKSKWVCFHPDHFRNLSLFEKFVFIPLGGTLIVTGLFNLFLVINLAPGNHDSMTSHLVRVAYYLQFGNYNFFDANYWGIVVHPRNSTSLFLYSYLVTGSENLTQIVQYISYWITILSVYGITVLIGLSRKAALFSALITGLLISVLMQATTTQNDLILTALIGSIVYYLFAFKISRSHRYLVLVALAASIALGVKASVALALIPAGIIAIYCIAGVPVKKQIQNYSYAFGYVILFVGIFTLTSGYVFNINKYGHPLGPEHVREAHTFESQSGSYVVKNGIKNSMRYMVEFISLDGLPTITPVRRIQMRLRGYSQEEFDQHVSMPQFDPDSEEPGSSETKLITYSGNNPLIHYVIDPEASRVQFNYFKMPATSEDFSYWGVFGFGLVWLTFFYSIFAKDVPRGLKILAIAAIVFFLLQSFAGPYDPWRGRYFNIAAIFMLPSAGLILKTKVKLLKLYLLFIIALGSVSALSGVILKSGSFYPVESDEESSINSYEFRFLFLEDRISQLTRLGPYHDPIVAFENIVPKNAAVAVYLHGGVNYEYPLFGENFSRTLYPINSFIHGVLPVPDDADYLLYYYDYPDADFENDILLGDVFGDEWYLRPLK